jgi:hypothetical protein
LAAGAVAALTAQLPDVFAVSQFAFTLAAAAAVLGVLLITTIELRVLANK